VRDTWLTRTMVARACGAHQRARVTSAGFEANGDLKAANKERDEDEGGITCRTMHARREGEYWVSPRSETGAVGHETRFRAQRALHRYSTTLYTLRPSRTQWGLGRGTSPRCTCQQTKYTYSSSRMDGSPALPVRTRTCDANLAVFDTVKSH
jgi:hypothetical protein